VRFATRLTTFIVTPSAAACATVLALCWVGLHSNGLSSLEILDRRADADEIALVQMHEHHAVQMMLLDPGSSRLWAMNLLTYSSAHAVLLARLAREVTDPELQTRATALQSRLQPILAASARGIASSVENTPEVARRRYLEEYQPAADQYAAELQWLTRRLDSMARESHATREASNDRTMWLVAAALAMGLLVVSVVLQVLGRKVERSKAAVNTLLEGMDEGMCLVDRHGRLSHDRSQALARILPGSAADETLPALLAHATGADPSAIQVVIDLLFAPDDGFFSPFEQTANMLPGRALIVGLDGRQRRVTLLYRPRYRAGQLEAIYFSAIDVTAAVAGDVEGQNERQQLQQILRAADAPESFGLFLEQGTLTIQSTCAMLSAAVDRDPTAQASVARDLHTLKGAAATFAFRGLAQLVHELEDHLLGGEESRESGLECCRRLELAWATDTARVLAVVQVGHRSATLPVSRHRLEALREAAGRRRDPWLAQKLMELDRVAPGVLLAPLLAEVQTGIVALQDCQAWVGATPDACDVSCAEAEAVRPALTHLLQNAVDHGLDTTTQRLEAGKPPMASILVHSERRADGGLEWQIYDDGKGIDGDKLAEKMVRLGHWRPEDRARATQADCHRLVFVHGLSSRDSTTLTSGRGVGNAAARDSIEARGGNIKVTSTLGVGTRFDISMPADNQQTAGSTKARGWFPMAQAVSGLMSDRHRPGVST
jgi:HPt (histidine-containing phosphotransfer) domain-containing protein